MALETGTYISDLVATNPPSNDPKSEGDNHIRLLKSTVKNTFPNVNGAVTASPTELNILDGATLDTAELNVLDGVTASTAEINLLDGVTSTTDEINSIHLKANIDSPTLTGTPKAPTAPAASTGTQIATLDFVNSSITNISLPGQVGNAGALMQTDGTNANWTKTINGGVVKLLSGGNIVGTSDAQTLTNKTINQKDSLFTLQDDADTTKQAKFECSSITTGTTRIITMPNEDITLGGSDYKLLQSFVLGANNATWEMLPTVIDSTYDVYDLVFYGLTVTVAGQQQMLFKSGASYITTNVYGSPNGVGIGQPYIVLYNGMVAPGHASGSLRFFLPWSTTFYKSAKLEMVVTEFAATQGDTLSGKAICQSTLAITGFKFYVGSGVINAGATAKWYGLKK